MNITESLPLVLPSVNGVETRQTVVPCLIVTDAVQCIRFLKEVFQAKELVRIPSPDDNDILHAEVYIGNARIMLASAGEDHKAACANMFVYVPNADETFTRALALGASPIRKPQDQEHGRTAAFIDPFGNTWWPTTIH